MRYIITIAILSLGIGSAYADNFMQNNNPFPQTSIQTMNNIYEAEPNTIQNESQKTKKSWFRKGKNLQQENNQLKEQYKVPVYPVPHEGAQDKENFYMFTTGQ